LNDLRVKWYAREFMTLATKANISAMKKSAIHVERYIKTHFTSPGAGRAYKRGSKIHRASLAGQPPAVDTGVLQASVGHKVIDTGAVVIGEVGTDIDAMRQHPRFNVGSDVNYGLYLELGTNRMQPRPWLRPALKKTKKQVEKFFKDANK